MPGEHLQAQARRVVAGVAADGRSEIVSDANTTVRAATAGFTTCQIWQLDSMPPMVDQDDASGVEASIAPPAGGFIYMLTTFPPDSEWDADSYREALAAAGDADAYRDGDGEIAGLHQTDTVDIITVLSGEIYAVLEHGETLLSPGDSFIQRGTKHAWSNRGSKPCTIVAVMAGADR